MKSSSSTPSPRTSTEQPPKASTPTPLLLHAESGKRRLWNIRGRRFGHPALVVAGGALAMLGLGTIYVWGTLTVFLSSPGFLADAPASTTVFVYAAALAMVPVAMIVSSLIQQRLGMMLTAIVGAVVAGTGIMCSAAVKSFVALLFTWGIIGGFGIGLAYVCCLVTPAKWFPRKKGLVTGICVACFGAGSFVFSLLVKAMANPTGMPTRCPVPENATICDEWEDAFHAEMQRTVPTTLITIGALSMGLGCIGALALQPVPTPSPSPSTQQQGEEGAKATDELGLIAVITVEGPVEVASADLGNEKPPKAASAVDVTPMQMAKMPQFWILWAFVSLALTAGMFVIGSYSEFARVEGKFSNPQYDIIGGAGAIGNALGRLSWGRMCDWVNWRYLFIANSLLLALLNFLYQTTISSQAAFALVTVLIFFSYGGFLGTMPSSSADAFGLQNVSKNYAWLFTATAVAALLQSILMKALIASIGFFNLFYLMGGLSIAAMLLVIVYRSPSQGWSFHFCKQQRR